MEMTQIFLPALYLVISLFVLIKGADVFIVGAKQIGLKLGMSSFTVGVLIVGVGTSLPELAASVAAVMSGASELVIANAVGSNITNILLIVGVMAAFGGTVTITKNLIRSELPIFLISTVHFIAAVRDGHIDQLEALLLTGTFVAYLWYLYTDNKAHAEANTERPEGTLGKPIGLVLLGVAGVLVGAHFTVESAVSIATALSVPLGLVSIGAIAIGTSLPELFVSIQAMRSGETELAIGNIFGSNAFNILMVVGLTGLFAPLKADAVVMELGIGILIAASIIFFVSGLAKQIQRWEGVMMLLFFVFFLAKLIAFV